jgi:hypothetical protein
VAAGNVLNANDFTAITVGRPPLGYMHSFMGQTEMTYGMTLGAVKQNSTNTVLVAI